MVKDILWLHQALKMVINEMDSNVNVGYPPELLDLVLNKSSQAWLNSIVPALESNGTLEEKLNTLVVRTPITTSSTIANDFQSALSPSVLLDNSAEYRFSGLDKPYFRFLSAKVALTKGTCTKYGKVRLEQHDDIETVLIDANRKPSYRYGEVVGITGRSSETYTIADANTVAKSLILYTEGGTTLGDLYMTYLKIPNQVSIGGYNDLNGNPMTRTELDIPQEYYPEIVKFAKEEVVNTLGFANK